MPDAAPILIVEDDLRLGENLRKSLRREGYDPQLARNLAEGRELWQKQSFVLVVLDWMLPDGEGLTLLRELRANQQRVAVLLLTARDEIEDRVSGLDAGADDYLTKPFALPELLARLRTLLRRKTESQQNVFHWKSLQVDFLNRRAMAGTEEILLTPREFDLLSYLSRHCGEIVSRGMLVRDVWQAEGRFTSLDNVIDVHMTNLRKKLRQHLGEDPITTLRGVGFRLSQPTE
ncbi:MAG: response regulator transcription factor [Opitutales bacterium]|nr:response regulator transcription factor [Opitutales bacterium]